MKNSLLPDANPLLIKDLSENDKIAFRHLENFKKNVWALVRKRSPLKLEYFQKKMQEVVQDIARIYHPEVKTPHFEISPKDLLELIRRISDRLENSFELFPLSLLSQRSINDYMRISDIYQTVINSGISKKFWDFLKQHEYLFNIIKTGWMLKNIFNPFYWGRKGFYEITKEGLARYLEWLFISITGEEAILLFGKKGFASIKQVDEYNVLMQLVYKLYENNHFKFSHISRIHERILNSVNLSDRQKVEILKKIHVLQEKKINIKQIKKMISDHTNSELEGKIQILYNEMIS